MLGIGPLELFIVGLFIALVILIIRLFQGKPVMPIVRAIVALIFFNLGLSMLIPGISFSNSFLIIIGTVPIGIGFCIFFIPLLRARAERRKPLREIQRKQQTQVDNQVDDQVERLYKRYGEEWINNAGRSRIAMAIDEMLGPAPRGNSNAARAQRTLAAAILETVLERKGETIRQQQAVSREDSQAGIVVDPMLAADIVDTAQPLAADADHTNDLDSAEEVDGFDVDDLDDIDMDVDLDID